MCIPTLVMNVDNHKDVVSHLPVRSGRTICSLYEECYIDWASAPRQKIAQSDVPLLPVDIYALSQQED